MSQPVYLNGENNNAYIHHNNDFIYSNQNESVPSNRNRFNLTTSNNQTNPPENEQIQDLSAPVPQYPTPNTYEDSKTFTALIIMIIYIPAFFKFIVNLIFAFINGCFAYLVFYQVSLKV
jgi:hypothetical protein